MATAGKWLFGLGLVIMLSGALLWLLGNKSLKWPRLPLDFSIDFPGGHVYIPIGTSILLSLVLSLLLYLIRRFF
ncbi:MAG: DUF2905 domain-containing protein [Bacteroidia bacterium]|nr:DUF2905 domain-containing protein [Bacteroidia bacterium]MCX7652085.1 DUF2905 domain-containing protein [Bacteroidia bacterium]MDW8417112.1 DUF2905 family protein [Bacteroidia bacterium]